MKYFYIIYQYLIAIPLFLILTVITAIVTIVTIPWKNSEVVHKFQQFWARCFCWFLFIKVEVTGLENIQKGQSYVFVSNHQSMTDVFTIYGWLPVVFKWIMKAELRKVPFVGGACKAAGHIFIDRSSRAAAKNSILKAKEVLHDGICIVIFPEGTRTKTGQVGRFKRGAFSIASDLQLPIVPISLTGCYEIWPSGRVYATHGKIHMHISAPMITEEYNDEEIEKVRQTVIDGMDK